MEKPLGKQRMGLVARGTNPVIRELEISVLRRQSPGRREGLEVE